MINRIKDTIGEGMRRTGSCRVASFRRILPIMFAVAMLAGCADTQSVRLPPVTSNAAETAQNGEFVWVDLVTEDVAAAGSFYQRLFGWRAATSEENSDYFLFYMDDKPMAGMVATESRDTEAPESMWLLTMSVDDVDETLPIVTARGGKVLEGPMDAEGRGRMALISDPAGAPLILLGAAGGGSVGGAAGAGQWLWTDLITQNSAPAKAFYTALAGYRIERIETGKDRQYEILKQGGQPIAGIVTLKWDGLADNWLPYFKVADVGQSIENARRLGGRLILKSLDTAVLADPTGAVFAIQMR